MNFNEIINRKTEIFFNNNAILIFSKLKSAFKTLILSQIGLTDGSWKAIN